MISSSQLNKIKEYLDLIVSDPKPELNYNNEFELLIAVVLSAQTTDKSVNKVTEVLFAKYKNASELSKAKLSDIELVIREIGLYHNKAKYIIEISKVLLNEKTFPKTREELMRLPGVGRKTANVVLSNLGVMDAIAVDTHVERVSKRLGLADETDNVRQVEEKLMKLFNKKDWNKMHHQLLLFGRYTCKALNPACRTCGLKDICLYTNKNNY